MADLRNYKVYLLRAPDDRVYVGMTKQTLALRCRKSAYIGCPRMEEAIDKFGWESFEKTILFDNLTKDEAEQLEKETIEKFDSTNVTKGFNVALGGNIVGRHSDETLWKMSESQKGRKFSPEHIKHLRKPKKNGAMRRTIKQYTKEGNLICVYPSLKDAATAVGAFTGSIVNCCNHKQHTAKGYVWEYGGKPND